MKTLIVSYLPGGNASNTSKLLEHFNQLAAGKEIKHIDLLADPPAWFDQTSLGAYYTRNYMGKELSDEQAKAIAPMDKHLEAVKEADVVVLVHPMHNFGIPGLVKLWYDNVMQAGIAFRYTEKGPEGLLKNKKALVLYTSAGSYSNEKVSLQYPEWNTLAFLSKIEFTFMGFDKIETIGASTGDSNQLDSNIEAAKNELSNLFEKWY